MKNKTLALFLCMVLVISSVLVGCGDSKSDESTEETVTASEADVEKEEIVEDAEPEAEPDPAAPLVEIYQKYIADGDFTDYDPCGREMGAEQVAHDGTRNAYIMYEVNGWCIVVTSSGCERKSEASVIAVGKAAPTNWREQYQRVIIADDSGNSAKTFDSGETIDFEVLDLLPYVMYYCINNPYTDDMTNVNPIEGLNWEDTDAVDRIWY